jgi:hypothetical protein
MSTQKLALQITMKSSCRFVFSHSVLVCPNLYSTLFDCLLHYSGTHYNSSAQTPQKNMSRVRPPVHWSVTRTGHGADDIRNTASSIVACWAVFTEPLSGNDLIKSVTTLCHKFRNNDAYVLTEFVHCPCLVTNTVSLISEEDKYLN